MKKIIFYVMSFVYLTGFSISRNDESNEEEDPEVKRQRIEREEYRKFIDERARRRQETAIE